ncbi:MAG TPA: amidohydrolase [Sphingomicrobium sp.]|nr:amidohydrolase [Sphingomicrobium sp.]
MKKTLLALAAMFIASPAFADTLISNVNGLSIDGSGKLQHFRSLLIAGDGRVKEVLADPDPKLAGVDRRVDGEGRTLLPGLIDAHGHVLGLGFSALQLDLVGTSSLDDLKARLGAYASSHPQARWIVGRGWNQELWPDKRFPTAADLDSVVGDRPVVLERVDGHALVVNSAAMKAAGVTPQTPTPPGGRIENGLFVDNAKELISKAVPPATDAETDQALQKAQDILLSVGVTGVGSMSTSLADWQAMRRAGEAGRLNVRFMVYADELNLLKEVPHPTSWLYGDRLRMVGIKFYADGALGSRGAWLKRPYADKPDTVGLRFHSEEEMRSLADSAASRGFQIATHAIGDAANAEVIGTYEWLNSRYGKERRWRIEHAQVVDCSDLPRIGRANIIASMQPTHQTSDRLMAEKRLDPARLKCAYAWQSMLRTGARLAFGTDFPVESPNPFPGLSAAISREDVEGQPPGGWYPQERVSFEQALAAYTRGAAYAGFAEDRIGAIEPGKWADFVIVDRDVTKVNPQELARTRVLETWIGGKKAWSLEPSASAAPERGK